MRGEDDSDVPRAECADSLAHRTGGSPDDAGAEVDEVRGVVDDDRRRGARAFRVCTGRAGSEENDPRPRRCRGLGGDRTRPGRCEEQCANARNEPAGMPMRHVEPPEQ